MCIYIYPLYPATMCEPWGEHMWAFAAPVSQNSPNAKTLRPVVLYSYMLSYSPANLPMRILRCHKRLPLKGPKAATLDSVVGGIF